MLYREPRAPGACKIVLPMKSILFLLPGLLLAGRLAAADLSPAVAEAFEI